MRYEDDALRFCTRDGSPLVEEGSLADSEALDSSGALQIESADTQEISPKIAEQDTEIPRIVIRATTPKEETARSDGGDGEETAGRNGGTLKTVLITMLVTAIVTLGAAWAIWMFAPGFSDSIFGDTQTPEMIVEPSPEPEPTPVVPIRSPSPTPSPSASPSPSPSPSPTPAATPKAKESPEPVKAPTPRASPTPDSGDVRPRRVQ